MARKGQPTSRSQEHSNGGAGKGKIYTQSAYVNVYLDLTDKQWLEAHRHEQLECIGTLLEGLSDEYKLQVKFDSYSGRYNATLAPLHDDHAYGGLILSVRGSTALNATFALSYAHFQKFASGWKHATSDPDSDFG